MSILGKYIAALFLKMVALCLGSFVSIYLVIDFLERIERFTRNHAAPVDIALYFLCKIPEMVSQVVPLAVLMSTLLTLGILSRSSEITAMRSCGISLVRISAPILYIALGISLTTLISNELILPATYQQMKYVEEVKIERKSTHTFFRQNNIWFREENAILQARLFTPADATLHGLTIWQMQGGMVPVRRLDAERGEWRNGHWLLHNVTERELISDSTMVPQQRAEQTVALSLRITDLKVLDKYADNLGFTELRRYCEKLRKGGYDATRYQARMHSAVALPFASLVMAFLGIPFSLRGGRSSGISLGIGLSLVIGFSYFVLNAMVLSFGQTGIVPALASAWAANFIFTLIGIWLAMRPAD